MSNITEFYDKLSSNRNIIFSSHPLHFYQNFIRYVHAFEMCNLKPKTTLLEIGCGTGYQLNFLLKQVKYYFGGDISFNSIKQCICKRNTYLFNFNAEMLPFKDDSFDVVLCLEVLEHLKDPAACVSEIRRILKPGGIIVASSPNWFSFYGLIRAFIQLFKDWSEFSDFNPEVDNWFNPISFKRLFFNFKIKKVRGSFFLPPFFLGKRYLLPRSNVLVNMYNILEKVLSKTVFIKNFGYTFFIMAVK